MSQDPKPDAVTAAISARAEAILADCARDMQSLAAGGMVFPSHLGRLRRLAEDMAAAHALPLTEVDARLKPFEDRLAALCGL